MNILEKIRKMGALRRTLKPVNKMLVQHTSSLEYETDRLNNNQEYLLESLDEAIKQLNRNSEALGDLTKQKTEEAKLLNIKLEFKKTLKERGIRFFKIASIMCKSMLASLSLMIWLFAGITLLNNMAKSNIMFSFEFYTVTFIGLYAFEMFKGFKEIKWLNKELK